MNEEYTSCKKCGSEKLYKKGFWFNTNKTIKRQSFECLDCHYHFLGNKRFPVIEEPFVYEPKERRPIDWSNYNYTKQREKERFLDIAREILSQFEFKQEKTGGRPIKNPQDVLLSILLKVYNKKDSRTTISELAMLKDLGYVESTFSYVTLMNYMKNPTIKPLLEKMIELTSLPFQGLEDTLSIDSSGLGVSKFARWYDHKWDSEKEKRMYRKLHLAVGTKSLVIASATVTKQEGIGTGDTSQFPELVKKAAINFKVKEILCDGAYLSEKNFDIAEEVGAELYTKFRKDSKGRGHGKAWKQMYWLRQKEPQKFLRKYHQRSLSETGFMVLKSKFNSYLMTKKWESNINEILAICVVYNICRLNAMHHELIKEDTFLTNAQQTQKIKVLV